MSPLVEIITREVQKHGTISFARFMELALYCPVYGYYEAEKDKIGRRGDFFTSVSVGSLFGELLAYRFSEWLEALGNGTASVQIVEAGAYNGLIACDILNWLQTNHPALSERLEYFIIEPSARRQQWQKETLATFQNVRWLAGFNSSTLHRFNGIIFSNELLDAMPVHRFGWDAKTKEWFEWGVTLERDRFIWRRMQEAERTKTFNFQHPTSNIQPAALGDASNIRCSTLNVECSGEFIGNPSSVLDLPSSLLEILPEGFIIETSPAAENWWRAAANALDRGKLLAIDYGLSAEELVVPERTNGTLRAYVHHHATDDLLANPGEQDLTAHVNFTAIQMAGEATGLRTETFESQAKFLTRILETIQRGKMDSLNWAPQRARQFQTLTHPEHLGRAFRVLVQSRQDC